MSSKIISQRSAVPAVISHATKPPKHKLTPADKERLLRIAKKPRKGPFNAIMDPTEFGAGSASIDVTDAVKNSGTHDLWTSTVEESLPDGLEAVRKRTIKVCYHPYLQAAISELRYSRSFFRNLRLTTHERLSTSLQSLFLLKEPHITHQYKRTNNCC